MKELIWVRVQYASRQQCCKTHKRPLPFFLVSIRLGAIVKKGEKIKICPRVTLDVSENRATVSLNKYLINNLDVSNQPTATLVIIRLNLASDHSLPPSAEAKTWVDLHPCPYASSWWVPKR